MNDFPKFMRNPLNAIDPKSQSPGNVGYVYDGIDGSQMAIWTSMEDVISREHVHNYDEYFIVVEGECKLKLGNETTIFKKAMNIMFPRGYRIRVNRRRERGRFTLLEANERKE